MLNIICVISIIAIVIVFFADIFADDVEDIIDATTATDVDNTNADVDNTIADTIKETKKAIDETIENIDKLSDTIESIQKKYNRILMKNKLEALKSNDFHKLDENDYKYYVETVKVKTHNTREENEEDIQLQHVGYRKDILINNKGIDTDKIECRTLYSRNKYGNARIYKKNKIRREKPDWKIWHEEE